MSRLKRWGIRGAVAFVAVGGLLAIPEPYPEVPERPAYAPHFWDRDALWRDLEQRYAAGTAVCPDVHARGRLLEILDTLERDESSLLDGRWRHAEDAMFELAVGFGSCPEQIDAFMDLRRRIRIAAKDASLRSGYSNPEFQQLYRLLYGSRAAVEELLLQMPPEDAPARTLGRDVPSKTPSTVIERVRIHSGDLLLSRGGAPTSAFIARGSNHPGNFSHVALVHIDPVTEAASVIEAHIERGVAIATPEQYFRDKKLRIMVLRLRPDHPALQADPMLPHNAAQTALDEARARHIPYDFEMDFRDPQTQFCSEVASSAYARFDVKLWDRLTAFSSRGLARWMAGFGVRFLETHGPSDLEYDRAVQVVAEWHDPQTLLDDHLDNAVIDAMLDAAEDGAALGHAEHMLPVARTLKAYSMLLNLFDAEGPVPEGMSATVALRARWLQETHAAIRTRVVEAADAFKRDRGYSAPYWELVDMARAASG